VSLVMPAKARKRVTWRAWHAALNAAKGSS
jgi:hypothetical protein